MDALLAWSLQTMQRADASESKIMFFGNGGSAAISSHMATDYGKNGGFRTLCFSDAATLTCLSNDLGYAEVFAHQIDRHARKNDVVVAISSSGASPNILRAVDVAREKECTILTLSGFAADNPLRRMGDWNVYLPSHSYGFVEIGHLSVLHAILDASMGLDWPVEPANAEKNPHA